MIKTLRQILLISQFLIIPILGQTQQIGKKALVLPNIGNLQKISSEQKIKYNQNRNRALVLAKKNNWIINENQADGSSISLQGLTESGRPIYYVTHNNETSAITTNTKNLWTGGSSGLNLNGSSQLLAGKLGIWDGGAVRATHKELTGRIINRDGATALNDHATHVSGTMISRGLNPIAKGMANGIPNLQTWNFNNDGSEIAGAASSLLVSNHSYGNLAGWRLIGSNWYWYGEINVNDKEDVYYGYYGNTAQLWDNIAFNSPYYLMVKAAGNSRNNSEPAIGQPYYRYNPTIGNWELITTGRTADMKSYTGYDVIPDHSVAKNILTVGSIYALGNGYTQPSDVSIFNTSSWGPTDDGRIKPDLVGSGVRVTSTFATHDEAYNYATGTSMASPNVSGSLILLQEHYSNLNSGQFMLAASLKGLAIHTANEAGATLGPDYIHGWGVLNTEQAAQVISNKLKTNQLSENILFQGQSYTQTIKASGLEPIKVSISWTDPAGTVLSMVPSTLNNRTPRLVNDLDVRVSSGPQTNLPWVLDPNNPAAAATTGDNIRDNVEQVLISNPIPGELYTVTVSHKGSLRNSAQAYSLIISGMQGIQYCASRANTTNGARIEGVTMEHLNNSTSETCNIYSDFTALATEIEAGQVISLAVKTGTCGIDAPKIVKAFIDWNADGDFEDLNETVATSAPLMGVENFKATIQVPTHVNLGTSTRMRLVLVETNNPETVSACGLYANGETEDYTLTFISPRHDVGITGISNPLASSFTANPDQGITLAIKNFGSISQTNIPLKLTIAANGQTLYTFSEVFTGTLATGEEKTFTLSNIFSALPATTYTFNAATTLTNDNIPTNNIFTADLQTPALTQNPTVTATTCPSSSLVNLQGNGNGTVFWYDAATGGNLLAAGNKVTTVNIPVNKTYYAALNQFNGTTASLQNNATGSFSNSTQDTIYFDAAAPFILDRLTLNAGNSGILTIALYNAANTLLSNVQVNVVPGAASYTVNLTIPAAGNKYRLLVSGLSQGLTLNQNNAAGTVALPYFLPALLTITNSRTGALNLYDWKIKAMGNPSARVATKLNGSLTSSANNLCAGNNTGTLTFVNPGTISRWESSTDGFTWTTITHNQNTYNFNNLAVTTHFRAIFNDDLCTDMASEEVIILVNPAPIAKITAGGSTKICPGSTLTLTASSGSSYLWSTGETTAQIIVNQPGNYSVKVTNVYGCAATSAAIVVSHCLTTWTGTTSSDWNNTANWTNGIPDADMDITIPANLTTYPVISTGVVNCKNIINQGSLSLTGGTINISENFTNTGTLVQTDDALLKFSGTVNHKIMGSLFQNLRIGGTGNKTLDSDITITGNLTIAEGTVTTGKHKIILNDAATLTETATKYIIGTVQATRAFKYGATQTFGNMGLSLTTTANPTPTIQVTRVTGTNAPGNIRSVQRYFDIAVTSGKATGLNATMEFTYLPGELNGFYKDNLALYRSADNGQTWTVQPNSVVDLNSNNHKVSLSGISAFSVWTVSDGNSNMVLPVTVGAFKVEKQKTAAKITWETITEKNNAGTEVEVSTDARHYRSLGFVPATGINTTTRQLYTYTDTEPNKTGIRYYRLKQTDLNGETSYYGPKSISFTENFHSEVITYPNPSPGVFAVLAQTQVAEHMELEVKNVAGQTIYTQQHALIKGENKVLVALPAGSPAGVYLVLARYNNTVHPIKMIVK